MILGKCEFCEEWDLENVNFVKNETLNMWIFGQIEDFAPVWKWGKNQFLTQFFTWQIWISWRLLPLYPSNYTHPKRVEPPNPRPRVMLHHCRAGVGGVSKFPQITRTHFSSWVLKSGSDLMIFSVWPLTFFQGRKMTHLEHFVHLWENSSWVTKVTHMDNFVMSFLIAKEVMSLKSKLLIVSTEMKFLMKSVWKSISVLDIGLRIFRENISV